jgi:hypothetical protein
MEERPGRAPCSSVLNLNSDSDVGALLIVESRKKSNVIKFLAWNYEKHLVRISVPNAKEPSQGGKGLAPKATFCYNTHAVVIGVGNRTSGSAPRHLRSALQGSSDLGAGRGTEVMPVNCAHAARRIGS